MTDGILYHLLLIIAGAALAFPIGSIVGQWQERRWQIQKRHMNRKLYHAQREVDALIQAHQQPTLEWYDNKHVH